MCRWGRSELVIDKYCLDKEGKDGRKCWGICQLCQNVLQDIVQLVKFKDIGDYQENLHSYIGVIISSPKNFYLKLICFKNRKGYWTGII